MGWDLMKSAPRDGQTILGEDSGGVKTTIYYDVDIGEWRLEVPNSYDELDCVFDPIYWHPLP